MNAPDYPVLAWIAAIVLACCLPRTVQRIRRRRATAVRRQLRADLMREAELQRVTGQRDRYCALYHEAVKRNAALLGLADVESTPIADGLHFARWADEMGDVS